MNENGVAIAFLDHVRPSDSLDTESMAYVQTIEAALVNAAAYVVPCDDVRAAFDELLHEARNYASAVSILPALDHDLLAAGRKRLEIKFDAAAFVLRHCEKSDLAKGLGV